VFKIISRRDLTYVFFKIMLLLVFLLCLCLHDMNFSTPWNLDMSVDTIPDNQPILHAMIHTQRVMFLVLFVLGIYYCWRIANHSLMHFNFRLIMVSPFIYAIVFSFED
jgi:hypothetical protein